MSDKSEIIIYKTDDGLTKIDVRLDENTVWLTQTEMVELFQSSKSNISEHIKHIFEEGELQEESVVRKIRTTAADGKSYNTTFYNLDVIISVGYRVKSLRGTQFRIWANSILKEYIIKGYTMDDERLKNLGGGKYFYELLNRINDEYGMELPFEEDDFDEEICEMSLIDYRKNMMEIYEKANLIKEELSEEETVACLCNIVLPGGKTAVYEAEFSRDELEDYIRDDIEKTVNITAQTIKEAEDKGVNKIDQIVLAGGSSNIPLVKEMLEDNLNISKVVYSDDVSTLISRGAAVMAKNLQDINNITEQITNVQLGVAATEGVQYGRFQMIIPENEPLPCSKTRKFNLVQDGQRRLEVIYYERDIKNYPNAVRIDDEGINEIDTLIIDNLPAGLKKDSTVIEVKFTAQKDGSLDIDVDIKDLKGNSIKHGDLSIAKESDLE